MAVRDYKLDGSGIGTVNVDIGQPQYLNIIRYWHDVRNKGSEVRRTKIIDSCYDDAGLEWPVVRLISRIAMCLQVGILAASLVAQLELSFSLLERMTRK